MGSFRRYVLPIVKDAFREIKAVGLKRAMTAAVVITDGLRARLADNELTREEIAELGLLTKAEAHGLAADILTSGLNISRTAANELITVAVKARKSGVPPEELGVKINDEDDDDDVEADPATSPVG
jgi:hypothetical protein